MLCVCRIVNPQSPGLATTAAVYFVLVILNLIMNKSHGLELAIVVHFVLVDLYKSVYHSRPSPYKYYRS